MKISYAFTCGRLEAIYRILNFRKSESEQNTLSEQTIIERYRTEILNEGLSFEVTELYKYLPGEEDKVISNRVKRILKENTGQPSDPRYGNDYRSGVWHELEEYKLTERLIKAKDLLNKKHLKKAGVEITSRDIGAMTGLNSTNLRNMLAHKKSVIKAVLERIEKLAEEY